MASSPGEQDKNDDVRQQSVTQSAISDDQPHNAAAAAAHDEQANTGGVTGPSASQSAQDVKAIQEQADSLHTHTDSLHQAPSADATTSHPEPNHTPNGIIRETLTPAESVSLDVGPAVTSPTKPKTASDSAAAAATLSPSSASHPPAKKFTSLNVNKKFLEKASPSPSPGGVSTGSASSVPKPSPSASLTPSSRLNTTSSTASRLTSAKLSAAGKPQPASWASPVAAAAKAASPMAMTASLSSSGSQSGAPSTSAGAPVAAAPAGTTSPKVNNSAPAPRLATALSNSTSGRAGSPHLTDASAATRSSPGIRNATLGSLNRSQSPATSSSGAASTAPWANIKPASITPAPAQRFANPDFPTAAEAAAAKKAQEEKEKAEAAEAAARHEAHMRQLDRFRGTSIGPGRHWDELDDEDEGFLDDVVEFADGTKYNVHAQPPAVDPAKLESEMPHSTTQEDSSQPPITKDQRFKDVDHDRSWPVRPTPTTQAPPATAAAKQAPPPAQPPAPRRTTVRETLDIMPGTASIALDDPMAGRSLYESRSRLDRDGGYSRGGRFDRDYGHEGGGASRLTQEQKAPSTAAVRAWGPLAVRQQSLNPNAAKVEPTPPPPAQQPQSQQSSAASPPTQAPLTATAPAMATPAAAATSAPTSDASPRPAALTSPRLLRRDASQSAATSGRSLPPHLAMQQQRGNETSTAAPTSSLSPPGRDAAEAQSTNVPRTIPWARRSSQQTAAATSPPQPSAQAAPTSPQLAQQKTSDQATEMLSAAERARRRRQEEEAQREAEKERARQKALAIEERMRKEEEAKAEAARKAKEEAEQEKRRQEGARLAAEKAKREEEEAAAAKRANVWRPKSVAGLDGSRSPELGSKSLQKQHAAGSSPPNSHRPPSSQPPAHSISDEASSWRRSKPLQSVVVPQQAPPRSPSSDPLATNASASASHVVRHPVSPQRSVLKRPTGGLAPSALDNMANLDDVIGRIRGAMQNGGQVPPVNSEESRRHAASIDLVHPALSPESPPRLLVNPERAAAKAASPSQGVRAPAPPQPSPAEPTHQRSAQQQQQQRPSQGVPTAKEERGKQRVPAERTSTAAPSKSAFPKTDAPAPQRPAAPAKPEPIVTRDELIVDDRPAWNRFKVSLKPSAKRPRLHKSQFGAQKSRMAAAVASDVSPPAAPYVLSWEPPIPTLSARTLNRDDHFFSKKFRKGKVISPVALPIKRLPRAPPAVLKVQPRHASAASAAVPHTRKAGLEGTVQVRLPGMAARATQKASAAASKTALSPPLPTGPGAVARPREALVNGARSSAAGASSPFQYGAPASAMAHSASKSPSSVAEHLVASRPELDLGKQRRRGSATTNGVAFAHNAPVGDLNPFGRDTPSPVNFMVTSELESAKAVQAQAGPDSSALLGMGVGPLPNATMSSAISRSASHTPLLPSTSTLGSSTWGQGPLSFLDTPKSSASGGADAGRIKDVWSRPDGQVAGSASMTPTQNSLRDIGDDYLPATLAMSLNDLKVDDAPMASGDAALHDASSSRRGGSGGGYAGRGLGVTSSSAFRTPSASAVGDRSERGVAPHLAMAGSSPHGDLDLAIGGGPGGGSNSAPSTSPNLLRNPKNTLPSESSSTMGIQRGSSLYPSAYIDAAADPFQPSARSSSSAFQYGGETDQGQHAIYSSLGPVETAGFGTDGDNFGSSYGSKSGNYSSWSLDPSAASQRVGHSNAYSNHSGPPTSSRMPFANRQQGYQGQQHHSRGPYTYNGSYAGGNGYGNTSSGRYAGLGNQYRPYGGQHDFTSGRGGQSSSGGLSSAAYGAGRDTSLASAIGVTRSGFPSQQQQQQQQHQQTPPHFARYQQGYGSSQQHQQSSQYSREASSHSLSSPFSKHASSGSGVDGSGTNNSGYSASRHSSQQDASSASTAASQATAASLWQQ